MSSSSHFQINDPSIESQWRALILFGRNSATYKFAFAKSLLRLANDEVNFISLSDLAIPFSEEIIKHLRSNDKQGNANSSGFLDACRAFIDGQIGANELHSLTEKLGFVNVVDAFQILNGDIIPSPFYEKDYNKTRKGIVITDELLRLKESFHFQNLDQEVESRWNLVETAWNLKINRNLIEVQHDASSSLLYLKRDTMRRVDVTSAKDALNGYQKGKCFYSFQDISINPLNVESACEVDHFLPHVNKEDHLLNGADINGVWNLVLADKEINRNKSARVPEERFLYRLFNRNEFYINSKHPLSETIQNQTGRSPDERRRFLQRQYQVALNNSIHKWRPPVELDGSF